MGETVVVRMMQGNFLPHHTNSVRQNSLYDIDEGFADCRNMSSLLNNLNQNISSATTAASRRHVRATCVTL
jgi:hypothetical protein